MTICSPTEARKNFHKLIESVANNNETVIISRKNGSVVMISHSDFENIQETAFLTGIPGMSKSLLFGLNEPLSECSNKIEL